MTFDPKTHKFGMAYFEKNSQIPCWPSEKTIGHDGKSIFYQVIGGKSKAFSGSYPEYRAKQLSRAPEHDLIPVALADKLADALREMRLRFIDASIIFEDDIANKALIEYEASK